MKIEVIKVDYSDKSQGQDLVKLLNDYACDPMGGGEPLAASVKANLPQSLAKVSNAFSLICYVDGVAAGLANCFSAFSTFQCRPLINIHDLVVSKEFRGLGIGKALLSEVDKVAQESGCCKVTLEVLEGNHRAKAVYEKAGFKGYELDPQMGQAVFWQKSI